MGNQRCGKERLRLMECEVPWPEDEGASKSLHLKTRGTPMSETPNDYIRRIKAFSTVPLWKSRTSSATSAPHGVMPTAAT